MFAKAIFVEEKDKQTFAASTAKLLKIHTCIRQALHFIALQNSTQNTSPIQIKNNFLQVENLQDKSVQCAKKGYMTWLLLAEMGCLAVMSP